MPHLDDIRCKHCNALVALIARASVVGRFTLRCGHCGVLLVVWPVQRVCVQERQEVTA
jgi:phage FluMu protein Com